MGFEQLAELKKQLSKQAAQEKTANQGKGQSQGQGQGRPKATGRPAAPRKRETETVDPVVHAIGKLQKRFPAVFPKKPEPKIPLKVGILADLLPHAEQLALSEAEIREAIATWCRGSRYWACLSDGATRVDLNGVAAGQVTARDMAFARSSRRGAPKRPRNGDAPVVPNNAPTAVDNVPTVSDSVVTDSQ
jgi:ProP effector